jgi:hypothetical protein
MPALAELFVSSNVEHFERDVFGAETRTPRVRPWRGSPGRRYLSQLTGGAPTFSIAGAAVIARILETGPTRWTLGSTNKVTSGIGTAPYPVAKNDLRATVA